MHFSPASLKPLGYSILLHAGVTGLLIFSLNSQSSAIIKPRPNPDIIKAVAVDNQAVENELQRLQQIEDEKVQQQVAAEEKLRAMEQQIAAAEKKRRNEEQQLAETRKKKEAETKKRQQEERRLAQLQKEKDEVERQRKQEEEKKRIAEQERKQEEERIRIAEEERQRLIAEAQQRKEEERIRRETEQALQEQLAEEQRLQAEAQARDDQQLLQSIVDQIYRRVVSNFNKTGLPADLECVFNVRVIPGGEVINVSLRKSSGNDIFDSRAMVAIQKASPLPVPDDTTTLDRLSLRQFLFRFKP